MALIDRVGRFRGRPTQGIMEETKNGFPQFLVLLEATEMWDNDTKVWVDWSEYQMTITAYLVLFNATKRLLNYDQVMKAFDWDGLDMATLQTDDFGDRIVQFEVEDNVYNGKTTLKVNWIDHKDATGGRGGDLTPSDAGKIKQMNAKYKQFMKTAPKATPASASAPPPVKVKAKAKPKKKALPAIPQSAMEAPPGAIEVDQIGAWTQLNEGANGASADDIGAAWLSAIAAVSDSDGTSEGKFTGLQWGNVLTFGLGSLNDIIKTV